MEKSLRRQIRLALRTCDRMFGCRIEFFADGDATLSAVSLRIETEKKEIHVMGSTCLQSREFDAQLAAYGRCNDLVSYLITHAGYSTGKLA